MTITHEEIYKIIEEAGTQVDIDKLNPDANLETLGADSLDIMNILLGVQEAMDIEIGDEEIEKLTTVTEICDYVNKRV